MKANKTASFSFRLTEGELERLSELAVSTERSAAGVVRQLIVISDLPEIRRLLGEIPQVPEIINRELA